MSSKDNLIHRISKDLDLYEVCKELLLIRFGAAENEMIQQASKSVTMISEHRGVVRPQSGQSSLHIQWRLLSSYLALKDMRVVFSVAPEPQFGGFQLLVKIQKCQEMKGCQ